MFGTPSTGPEVVIFPLLAIRDHRRARRFEASIVSRIASSNVVSRAGSSVPRGVIASIKATGLGMLPIGSIGMVITMIPREA